MQRQNIAMCVNRRRDRMTVTVTYGPPPGLRPSRFICFSRSQQAHSSSNGFGIRVGTTPFAMQHLLRAKAVESMNKKGTDLFFRLFGAPPGRGARRGRITHGLPRARRGGRLHGRVGPGVVHMRADRCVAELSRTQAGQHMPPPQGHQSAMAVPSLICVRRHSSSLLYASVGSLGKANSSAVWIPQAPSGLAAVEPGFGTKGAGAGYPASPPALPTASGRRKGGRGVLERGSE